MNPETSDYNFIKDTKRSRQNSIEPRPTGQKIETLNDGTVSIITNPRPRSAVLHEREKSNDSTATLKKQRELPVKRVFKIVPKPQFFSKMLTDAPEKEKEGELSKLF